MQENCIETWGFQVQTMIVSLTKNYYGYKITKDSNELAFSIVLLLMLKVFTL